MFESLGTELKHSVILDMMYSPQRLRSILLKDIQSVVFCDHIEATGDELFALAYKNDLEGTVAKHKFGRSAAFFS